MSFAMRVASMCAVGTVGAVCTVGTVGATSVSSAAMPVTMSHVHMATGRMRQPTDGHRAKPHGSCCQ